MTTRPLLAAAAAALLLASCATGPTPEQQTAARDACLEYLGTAVEFTFAAALAADESGLFGDAEDPTPLRDEMAALRGRCDDPAGIDADGVTADPDAPEALAGCQELVSLMGDFVDVVDAEGFDAAEDYPFESERGAEASDRCGWNPGGGS